MTDLPISLLQRTGDIDEPTIQPSGSDHAKTLELKHFSPLQARLLALEARFATELDRPTADGDSLFTPQSCVLPRTRILRTGSRRFGASSVLLPKRLYTGRASN